MVQLAVAVALLASSPGSPITSAPESARAACALKTYPRVGRQADAALRPGGPGLVLMGGGRDVDDAFRWMARTINGPSGGPGGDVVVIRASGDNAYDSYIHSLGRFNSVRTVVVPACATTRVLADAAALIRKAQGVFFAGGDQAEYVAWKGTALSLAVQRVYDRGGVVGGTSAGLAILGQFAYDSVVADRQNTIVRSADAISNPYETSISFTACMFAFPPLRDAITDSHFIARDRLGRLAAFMARLAAAKTRLNRSARILGIGINERTAIVIDRHGLGTLKTQGPKAAALMLVADRPAIAAPGEPLVYQGLTVTRLDRAGQTFDFNRWCGHEATYRLSVDGRRKRFYSPANPYAPPPGALEPACASRAAHQRPKLILRRCRE